jgi:hypothetical protein
MRTFVNRILALIVALALIAVAALVVIEVVAQLAGAQPVVVDWPAALEWAHRTRWNDGVVKVIGVLLILVGFALIVLQLWPSRVRRLPVESPDPETDAAITRRGLRQDVTAAVDEVDGVTPVRVTVRRRRIKVVAASRSAPQDRPAARDAVTASVLNHLDRLRLRRRPRLAVDLSRRP